MAYAKSNKQVGSINSIDEFNNSPKRKNVFKMIWAAVRSLPSDDKDFIDEPVNKKEAESFRAVLAAITNNEESKKKAEEYRASLKAEKNKADRHYENELNKDENDIDDLQK